MKKSITITIPEPCHEDWSKMTPTKKGKFCAVCTKEVFDFTKSTDEELIKSLEFGKNLCGRFKSSQLDREVKMERKSGKGLLPYAASLLIPLSLMGASEAYAQGGPMVTHNEFKSLNIGSNAVKSIVTITGFVTDTNNIPVANAEVFVRETGKSVRTRPDGSYKLVCISGSTIFSLKGELKSEPIALGTMDAVVDLRLEEFSITRKVPGTTVGLIITKEALSTIEQTSTHKAKTLEIQETDDEWENEETENSITISGTVFDEQKMPFPGVNVMVKGSSTGVQTDFDGNYKIEVPASSTLVFSYLGFENKEVTTSTIPNTLDLDLTLIEEWILGEVIAVYNASNKRELRMAKRKAKADIRRASRLEMKAERRNWKRKIKNKK